MRTRKLKKVRLDSFSSLFKRAWHSTFDSSVGRAVDCSWLQADIHRSLVQIRLEGFLFHPPPLQSVRLNLNRSWLSARREKHDFRKALSKAHFSTDETRSCLRLCMPFQLSLSTILDSLVVRISACHVEGPGSIPGRGVHFFAVQALFAVCLHISDRTSSCYRRCKGPGSSVGRALGF